MAAARSDWRIVVMPRFDPARLVFLDETWATTAMARTHGYAPKGERLIAAVPHGHGKTTTVVAGLRLTGMVAPMVADGALTGDLFAAYVRQQLVPVLRPGDVVVMDNLACHKVAGVAEAIRAAKAEVRYLPAYSPDLNPIENAFSKLKRLLRKAAERTVDGLWSCLGRRIDEFHHDECRNDFRHCGYAATPPRSPL